MSYSVQQIANIIQASAKINYPCNINYLLTDTRQVIDADSSLFFALGTHPTRNGHHYIPIAYNTGIKNFVVQLDFDDSPYPNANFFKVYKPLEALQKLAAFHRSQFNLPVIGITGSNGKTIVKEWLFQLLNSDYKIVRSPRSYNSQIGVPLSVWRMASYHQLGIFEAGISLPNEMSSLQKVIQPTIGILTSIGDAHNEGFENLQQKIQEKLSLFQKVDCFIYCTDDLPKESILPNVPTFSWGSDIATKVQIIDYNYQLNKTLVRYKYNENVDTLEIPFTDKASIHNALTCFCCLLYLKVSETIIHQRMQLLQPIDMRMQLKKGIQDCTIINDSYSNDIDSFGIALDYLQQQAAGNRTTVIVSDFLESGIPTQQLYENVSQLLKQKKINRCIAIGNNVGHYQQTIAAAVEEAYFFMDTTHFLNEWFRFSFQSEYILLKGARKYAFERIANILELQVHETILEVNLTALAQNLRTYRQLLAPTVKTMAMVKAFGYGSGSIEVAKVLQFYHTDYLAVAYIDEGVSLRKAGIALPIMVMNIEESGFNAMVEYGLEPEIFSFQLYHLLHKFLLDQGIENFPVHIKVDTGMHRLGFNSNEANTLGNLLSSNYTMHVKSVFSHLASAENALHDHFTKQQNDEFIYFSSTLHSILNYQFLRHIANSAAIVRHKNLQYDMVRLGIGLYGVNSAAETNLHLQPVASLKTTIAQIKHLKPGDSVGYNRTAVVQEPTTIATIRIGYADGFSKRLSNGIGFVFINGHRAPVIGSVCMDMTMINISHIPNVKEGDSVEIFGKNIGVEEIAKWCATIPYEILTGISQRVKRVYLNE
ncbi:bifunctional UDP-N-acetylmuramoyl-tripeptide:D-alanyl-D-alanine ligase/alanine racemase [Hydrotalea sp.]|uniref:bifunctional UDP-N-acetylmuramoyl-tripeptide:D-alanyl-D-alanine ligase/alanine racemase n=1 Tax=Hydrotalea sp. TaxID=2881279 RepID=UPI003D0C5B14